MIRKKKDIRPMNPENIVPGTMLVTSNKFLPIYDDMDECLNMSIAHAKRPRAGNVAIVLGVYSSPENIDIAYIFIMGRMTWCVLNTLAWATRRTI